MHAQQMVPLHGLCGYAPGQIAAYSNGSHSTFTNKRHYEQHYFMGYKWQCVEFARRWLLHRKGLVLPQYDFAAHFVYLRKVHDIHTGTAVPCQFVPQGAEEPPQADSLIVYPGTSENIVGHVGVITHVASDSVGVADQNRFFHYWGERSCSAEFPLECVGGRYYIRDPEVECRGWIAFPECPNLPEGESLSVEPYMRGPQSLGLCQRLSYIIGQFWSCCIGRESTTYCLHKGRQ
ncbi:putative trypanothione synthetase [Trypanosoma grayi]|uniref:putative trypanothione synthetase n=1 Tax=Trypanosoma grayi TaxID=71804 RepID=UPI0004F43CEB|nr:putative trypanothione synthetase [Trypanosoma grayi]KEG12833.1 putative trypanothione synthetase [Trypanosoma grayi]